MRQSIKLNLIDSLLSLLNRKQKMPEISIKPKRDLKPMLRNLMLKIERERLKRKREEHRRPLKMQKLRQESKNKELQQKKLKRSLLLSKLEMLMSLKLPLRLPDKMLKNKKLLLWLKPELKRPKGLKQLLMLKFKPLLRNSKEFRQLKPLLSKLKRIDLKKRQDLLKFWNNKELKMS